MTVGLFCFLIVERKLSVCIKISFFEDLFLVEKKPFTDTIDQSAKGCESLSGWLANASSQVQRDPESAAVSLVIVTIGPQLQEYLGIA